MDGGGGGGLGERVSNDTELNVIIYYDGMYVKYLFCMMCELY